MWQSSWGIDAREDATLTITVDSDTMTSPSSEEPPVPPCLPMVQTPSSPYAQDPVHFTETQDLKDPPVPAEKSKVGILPPDVSQSVHPDGEVLQTENVPPAIDSADISDMFQFSTPRIFLDLCSGVSSPLS